MQDETAWNRSQGIGLVVVGLEEEEEEGRSVSGGA